MARDRGSLRSKQMPHHLRRKLSEEGKRLPRHALAHEDDDADGVDQRSVDFSILTNKDDSSAGSDLEGFAELEQQKPKRKAGGKKWKDQYHEDDEDLEKAIDELTEKRDSAKIEALNKILDLLCGTVMSDRVGSSKVTLTTNALACLKKRMKESGTLALRTLGVLAVTLGQDEPDYYNDILTPLQRIVTDPCDPALRVEAAYTLSIACFVCCSEDQMKWELIDIFGHLLVSSRDSEDDDDDYPETLVIAVMECWAFLVSSFRTSQIVQQMSDPNAVIFDHVAAVAEYVRDGVNPSVRSAACEVLALLIQLKYQNGGGSWSYEMENPSSALGGLDTKIEKFMRETGKNIGKKNRKVQRSMLKEVLETLESGEGPHHDLQIEDETLSISTWRRFYQAHVFRRTLLTGFQVHLFQNEVLRGVFDVSENENAKVGMISTVKQRASHKSRAVGKRNDVSRKSKAQNSFLYEN
ncbi:TPA: hypothetical protein N0F65_003048 [Lagenidium giganteum]|uniref:Interferon-related developmental regulator N-terminal domain-containing protein n=1 Tax=Lagenidium giganteum TaxID=4803 RepID=A0AAV2YIJ8_9STRA|nr:TPA: hypothetical protein N0F65_003048 [Lagenidium giganteum]